MPLSEIEAEMNLPLTSSPVTPYHQTQENNHATSATVIHSNSNEEFHDNYIFTPNSEENSTTIEEDNDEEPPLSLDELMYSANSFHAITRPVSFTMILAALAAVYINDEETMAAEEAQFAESYQVWDLDSGGGSGSWSKNLLASVGNAFVMVLVIAAMTFGIVLLYKYRCMKILIGYMVFSSASLLGVLGDYLSTLAIEIYRIPIDVISYNISIYNFAVVGVIAIFYQKGIPSYVTQIYLVFTSVILAWHLSHFDEWTAWTLLVMLALYDLCAVLTPCGPLRALVNAMQEDGSPDMPGLLYEAHLPPGTKKPGSRQTSRSQTSHHDTEQRSSPSRHEDSDEDENYDDQDSKSTQPTANLERKISSEKGSNAEQASQNLVDIEEESSSSPLTRGTRATIPLAIAKVYRLQVVHSYGTSSPRNRRRDWNANESIINEAPLLTDTSEEYYAGNFSVSQLCADVEVEFPRDGGRIEKDCSSGKRPKYLVYNRENELRRILIVSPKGNVFEVTDDGDDNSTVFDEPSSIRLGLGDFIFYSVMVAKAAMYSFTTFAACMLVILSGLGGTLVLLSVYHSALPALPISIFLGVIFYLLTKVLIEPYIEVIMTSPVYV